MGGSGERCGWVVIVWGPTKQPRPLERTLICSVDWHCWIWSWTVEQLAVLTSPLLRFTWRQH
eukprot:11179292-Lingulodinium_polyedra.AAC.1